MKAIVVFFTMVILILFDSMFGCIEDDNKQYFVIKGEENQQKKLDNSINDAKQDKIQHLKLKKKLEPMIEAYDGDYSVYVCDLVNETEYIYKSKAMPAASMIKMYILALAYEEIQQQNLTEDEVLILKSEDIVQGSGNIQEMFPGSKLTIKKLLYEMIVESDNVATNIMIERLGMAKINNYIARNDYHDTKLQRVMMDFAAQKEGRENYTSVRDLGKIFSKIYKGECVSATSDQTMIEILLEQTDKDKIPAGLPKNAKCAHKTGEVIGVYNDGGIVYSAHGDYVLVVMTNNVGSEAITNIKDISKQVWELLGK